jgi:hypothetical protein
MLTREEQIKKNQMARMPKEKKTPKPIAKVSEKKMAQIAEEKAAGTDGEMDLFFDAMLKKCTGKCLFCNSKTTAADTSFWRDDNEKWSQEANDRNHERRIEVIRRASIAHLLPKRPIEKGGFPSVGTHEDNWIELCWNCHTMFDSGKITWEFIRDSAEWEFIKEKLLNVLPLVAQEERKVKLYSKLEQLVYAKS